MQKRFALGDTVKRDKGGNGVVRAVFLSKDGQLTYAVEKEQGMDFVDESRLSPIASAELAA